MLFLPPYSPDFNPIENAFSKLKSILRKSAARSVAELWDAIRDALPRFTPNECANYFTLAQGCRHYRWRPRSGPNFARL